MIYIVLTWVAIGGAWEPRFCCACCLWALCAAAFASRTEAGLPAAFNKYLQLLAENVNAVSQFYK